MDKKDVEKIVNERLGLRKTLELFQNSYNVVLIAPTGYGKTVLSLKLLEVAKDRNISAGLIHVAPYRALVREIYLEKFSGTPASGWQMHGSLLGEGKSPYYLKELVVTTLDSFIYNLYRIPVAEVRKIIEGRTQGHYYPVLASIFTSTVVFDEAHFYLDETFVKDYESIYALYAALNYLSRMGVPVVVETATMKSTLVSNIVKLLENGGRATKVVYVGGNNEQTDVLKRILGEKLVVVEDNLFSETHSFNWRTEIIGENNLLEKVQSLCKDEPVLIVRNTVKKAVETYQAVRDKCGEVTLLHGLLSESDKENALEKAKSLLRKRRGAIVSTQIIEAGVEIGGSTMITDAAPIENLAQRAGRLCRDSFGYKEMCRESGAKVVIVENTTATPYSERDVEKTVMEIRNYLNKGFKIDWRLLENREESGYVSFSNIIESIGSESTVINEKLLSVSHHNVYLMSDAQPEVLIKLMKEFGVKLIDRGYLLVVAIPKHESILNELTQSGFKVENGRDLLNYFEFVTTDLERLSRFENNRKDSNEKCLLYDNENYPQLLVVYRRGGEVLLKLKSSMKKLIDVHRRGYNNISYDDVLKIMTPKCGGNGEDYVAETYLIAKPSCYEKELGLKIWV